MLSVGFFRTDSDSDRGAFANLFQQYKIGAFADADRGAFAYLFLQYKIGAPVSIAVGFRLVISIKCWFTALKILEREVLLKL